MLKNDVGPAYAAVTIAFTAGLPPFDRAQGRLRYDLRSILRQAQDVAQGAPNDASRTFLPHPQSRLVTPSLDDCPTSNTTLV